MGQKHSKDRKKSHQNGPLTRVWKDEVILTTSEKLIEIEEEEDWNLLLPRPIWRMIIGMLKEKKDWLALRAVNRSLWHEARRLWPKKGFPPFLAIDCFRTYESRCLSKFDKTRPPPEGLQTSLNSSAMTPHLDGHRQRRGGADGFVICWCGDEAGACDSLICFGQIYTGTMQERNFIRPQMAPTWELFGTSMYWSNDEFSALNDDRVRNTTVYIYVSPFLENKHFEEAEEFASKRRPYVDENKSSLQPPIGFVCSSPETISPEMRLKGHILAEKYRSFFGFIDVMKEDERHINKIARAAGWTQIMHDDALTNK